MSLTDGEPGILFDDGNYVEWHIGDFTSGHYGIVWSDDEPYWQFYSSIEWDEWEATRCEDPSPMHLIPANWNVTVKEPNGII